MKLIDKYVLLSFVRNFLFGLLCFLVIFILVDLFENIDKFIDKNLPAGLIISYYITFVPEIIRLVTPVSMLLSTLFTTGRFISLSEMTAINSAGVSIYRYSIPLLITGAAVSLVMLYFNGWVVPYSNAEKLAIERTYIGKNRISGTIQQLSIQDSENSIITMRLYNETARNGEMASLQLFDSQNKSSLSSRYDAAKIRWDSISSAWLMTDVSVRKFDSAGLVEFSKIDTLRLGAEGPEPRISVTPERISTKQKKPEELMITELREYIDDMRSSGLDVTRAEVDYYSKISFPFANIIVIIFGVSLSLNQRKGSAALQFGISILVTFIYLGFIKISQTFGYNGDINPVLTAWLANILFLTLGVFNFIRINR